jgi:hypothetical protein
MILTKIFNLIEEISSQGAIELLTTAKNMDITPTGLTNYLLNIMPSFGNRFTSDEFDKIADQLGVTKRQLVDVQNSFNLGNHEDTIKLINDFRRINNNDPVVFDNLRKLAGDNKIVDTILDKAENMNYLYPLVFLLLMFLVLLRFRKSRSTAMDNQFGNYNRLQGVSYNNG